MVARPFNLHNVHNKQKRIKSEITKYNNLM